MFSHNTEGINGMLIISFFCFVGILITDTVFSKEPKYTKNSCTKAHCIVDIKEIVCVIFSAILRQFVGIFIFSIVFAGFCMYFMQSYFYYLPYMSMKFNVLSAQL